MKTAFTTHRANRAESAGVSFRGLLLLTGFALLPLMLAAVPPAWWQERGVLDSAQQPDDFAAVNTGQLKHIAKQAMLELDARIPGGAGTAIHQLIDAWPGQTAGRNDFAAVNAGQVKAVAKLVYDRLNVAGYTQPYPWNASAPGKDDFAGVNVGQLKAVFAFCVDCQPGDDTDGDGLGDAWEMTFFGSLAAANGDDDNDQDGIKNYVEFHYHSSPLSSDTDADGLTDNAEILTFGTNPAATDTDADGWGDGQEFNHQSDPKAAASTPLTVNPNLLTQIIRVNVERMSLDNTWWGETALTVDPPSAFHYSFQTRIAQRGSGAPAILPSYPVIDNQYEFGPEAAAAPDMTLPLFSALTVDFAQLEVAASSDDETIGTSFLLDHDGDIDYTAPIEWEDASHYLEFRMVHFDPYVLRLVSTEPVPFAVTYPLVTERRNRAAAPGSPEAATETANLYLVLGAGKTIGTPQIVSPSPTTDLNAQWETQVRPFDVALPPLPIEIKQHPVTATSGAGAPPTSNGPIRFCRWLDAYPNGQRDNQFADKDRDRFQIRIPSIIPNLTKMTIKATDLHGAVINGAFQNKTTDGNYEMDMKQENGGMVSEPILLVSDGDDDVTFNGKGTDNGKNDQTLLADFGSKIIVTFPELGNGETTFQAQQPIGTITLDMVYCHPKAVGAPPPSGIPADMIPLMERQAQKLREIYRQIGIKVDGFSIALITFPDTWVQDNGTTDPANNLNGTETDALMALVESSMQPSKRIRVGFVGAHLTNSQTGGQIGGKVKTVGQDPCLVSLDSYGRDKFNILAHEAGHASALPHNYLYDPNINHWLMRFGVEPYWSNDSNAAKRFRSDDADYIKSNSSYYVPAQ